MAANKQKAIKVQKSFRRGSGCTDGNIMQPMSGEEGAVPVSDNSARWTLVSTCGVAAAASKQVARRASGVAVAAIRLPLAGAQTMTHLQARKKQTLK